MILADKSLCITPFAIMAVASNSFLGPSACECLAGAHLSARNCVSIHTAPPKVCLKRNIIVSPKRTVESLCFMARIVARNLVFWR